MTETLHRLADKLRGVEALSAVERHGLADLLDSITGVKFDNPKYETDKEFILREYLHLLDANRLDATWGAQRVVAEIVEQSNPRREVDLTYGGGLISSAWQRDREKL